MPRLTAMVFYFPAPAVHSSPAAHSSPGLSGGLQPFEKYFAGLRDGTALPRLSHQDHAPPFQFFHPAPELLDGKRSGGSLLRHAAQAVSAQRNACLRRQTELFQNKIKVFDVPRAGGTGDRKKSGDRSKFRRIGVLRMDPVSSYNKKPLRPHPGGPKGPGDQKPLSFTPSRF